MDVLTYAALNKKVEEAKNVFDEKISESVNAYLDKNPHTTGATAEQVAQIDKNVADIDELKGDMKNIVTEEGSETDATKIIYESGSEEIEVPTMDEFNSLKKDMVKLTSGTVIAHLIKDSYVEKNGVITPYSNWCRTEYIEVERITSVKVNNPSTSMPYCCFYDKDKNFVLNFQLNSNETNVYVPENVSYMILSGNSTQMLGLEMSITEYSCETIKKHFERLSKDCLENVHVNYIASGYVDEYHGTITKAALWVNSDYITVDCKSYVIYTDLASGDTTCNAFYDADKNFIAKINIANRNVVVPENAKYMRLSRRIGNYIYLYKPKKTSLKVCSFNVGIWTNGVSSNARVADEDVPVASVKLRRFLGNMNADFVLCEEAVDTFNKSKTINAYDYCFKNNLPYGWYVVEGSAESEQLGIGAKQMLLTSKYQMNNITHHSYVENPSRGYMTFDCDIDGKTVNFIVAHASTEGTSDGIRQKEMEELAEVLRECDYGVLTGDFNAFSIDEFTNHFGDFNIANHGYFGDFETWPSDSSYWASWNKCLDNIITTKNIKIENVYMGDVDMSDHKPLVAELLIN